MKEKITQWAEQISISKKGAWFTMLGVIVAHGLVTLIISLIASTLLGVISAVALQSVVVFLGFMIIAGCTSWASKTLGFQKRGFIRALGATALVAALLFVLGIVISVLGSVLGSLVAMTPAILLVIIIVILASIPVVILFSLFVFSKAYGITRGKAFGLLATAHAFLSLITVGILLVLGFVATLVLLPALENAQQSQMQADGIEIILDRTAGDLEIDAPTMQELQAAFGDLEINQEEEV